ncbi:hypothetical protein [Neobacillus bataviensis]|uniref:hypothetical protein n=1 Tax=Neobacillus bataviensis TaxID=220685 RepID=UPI001CBD5DFE|nr:hypothetical protein [Neobacillus bataviensis]
MKNKLLKIWNLFIDSSPPELTKEPTLLGKFIFFVLIIGLVLYIYGIFHHNKLINLVCHICVGLGMFRVGISLFEHKWQKILVIIGLSFFLLNDCYSLGKLLF